MYTNLDQNVCKLLHTRYLEISKEYGHFVKLAVKNITSMDAHVAVSAKIAKIKCHSFCNLRYEHNCLLEVGGRFPIQSSYFFKICFFEFRISIETSAIDV